jgi:hypothetical protein
LFCWTDDDGNLWVASIDPATGEFIPSDGRGTLITTDSFTANELGNGPEWIYTDRGPQIVYTRRIGNSKFIARAFVNNGNWVTTPLSVGGGRQGPLGSLDRGDATPIVSYQGPNAGGIRPVYLRQLNDSSTEQMIPTTNQYRTPGARSIPGTNAVIFSRFMPEGSNPPRQVFVYDWDTRQLDQLTFDDGNKKAVVMWQAPEYDNEYVFFVMVNESSLGIYRYLDLDQNGSYRWTKIQSIAPPSEGRFIWSPEVFVYEGKSYISMTMSPSYEQRSFTVPTEVWMASIDPVDPLYRKLSGDVEWVRQDPEVYFSDQGPYVYVSWFDEDKNTNIYRLDTGLGPQAQ